MAAENSLANGVDVSRGFVEGPLGCKRLKNGLANSIVGHEMPGTRFAGDSSRSFYRATEVEGHMSKSGQQHTKADEGGQRPADASKSKSKQEPQSNDNTKAAAKSTGKQGTLHKKSEASKGG